MTVKMFLFVFIHFVLFKLIQVTSRSLLVLPPWEGSLSFSAILSPSPQPPHKPTTHTQISLRVFSQTPKPALPRFLPHRTGLAPDLSFPFPAFVLLSSNQQACTRLFIHHVYGFLRFGVWNRFLDFRSTHLHPLSQDMLLSNGFAGVPGVHQWSSPSPPSSGR
jgi:hypothetical protein